MSLLLPGQTDLRIRRGDTAYLEGQVLRAGVGLDLSGKVMRFTARESAAATGDPILAKTSTDGGIVFGTAAHPAAEGGYRVRILPADTSALVAPRRLAYDVELDEAGVITTVAHGKLYIDVDVTR